MDWFRTKDSVGETPTAAVETTALPKKSLIAWGASGFWQVLIDFLIGKVRLWFCEWLKPDWPLGLWRYIFYDAAG